MTGSTIRKAEKLSLDSVLLHRLDVIAETANIDAILNAHYVGMIDQFLRKGYRAEARLFMMQ